jgi:xanthine/uracil/vitamin C permease (AzgA family)
MTDIDNVQLSRKDKPPRKFFENPCGWWQGTSMGWNSKIPLWTGSGEAEALAELFFDNLATLLGVTGALEYIGFGIIGGIYDGVIPGFGTAIGAEWMRVHFTKNIPGVAFALLFGNAFYAYQCGRLGAKEGREDVTAQPYGMNTTGIYITVFAVGLNALFAGVDKHIDKAFAGDIEGAAKEVVDYAWKVSVAGNFMLGIFEILGAVAGETVRKVTPTAAFYSPLLGVGFVWLAFSPMLSIAAEPIMCLVPLLIVMCGFFGGVRYRIFGKVTFPIALLAILVATIAGWAGACKKTAMGAAAYGYNRPFGEEEGTEWMTCAGSSKVKLDEVWEEYAGHPDVLSGSVFVGLGGLGDIGDFTTTLLLVGMVGFTATMSCVESASAAGDDYPMAETMIVDGLGTIIGACFGSYFSTTVYIGHPIHKALGAKRGYSLFNGLIYFILLLSGIFASIYESIPGCANGAILVFVGLLLGRQAFEETKPSHYPALLLSTFPYICNWAKLLPGCGEGVLMMGQAGGLLFSFVVTWAFCLCIDRKFKEAAILSFVAIWLSLFGIFASHNMEEHPDYPDKSADKYRGANEKIGFYPKEEEHDYNQGWRWALAWGLAVFFFLVQFGMQKIGYIAPPVEDEKAAESGEKEPNLS